MRKDYWKEGCLLLIGLILGYSIHSRPLPIKETTSIKKDTVVVTDTIFVKATIPTLSRENVLAELKKQNVPYPKIVLAQSIHETGNYKSKLCKTHNNIFGLKAGNKYKKYESYIDCISDYKKRISSRLKDGENYYKFLTRIRYAEDTEYIAKLKRIVQKLRI